MKKKEFLSKLKFQKTTVVSFNSINTIKGGTLQGADTQIVSVNGFTCNSVGCIPNPTLDDACLSQVVTVCTRPTNTKTDHTDFCVSDISKRDDCAQTLRPLC